MRTVAQVGGGLQGVGGAAHVDAMEFMQEQAAIQEALMQFRAPPPRADDAHADGEGERGHHGDAQGADRV